jgi:hypothetical protein
VGIVLFRPWILKLRKYFQSTQLFLELKRVHGAKVFKVVSRAYGDAYGSCYRVYKGLSKFLNFPIFFRVCEKD